MRQTFVCWVLLACAASFALSSTASASSVLRAYGDREYRVTGDSSNNEFIQYIYSPGDSANIWDLTYEPMYLVGPAAGDCTSNAYGYGAQCWVDADAAFTYRGGPGADEITVSDYTLMRVSSMLVYGGTGDDVISVALGESAASEIFAGSGDDWINTTYGNADDIINCGDGYDHVYAEPSDIIGRGCEEIIIYDI